MMRMVFGNLPCLILPVTICWLSVFLLVFCGTNVYLQEMVSIPIGEIISFDHTYKIASNIGYMQVLTWQLTKGTSVAEVAGLSYNPWLKDQVNI